MLKIGRAYCYGMRQLGQSFNAIVTRKKKRKLIPALVRG